MTEAQRIREAMADPVKFVALCWPEIKLYDKQQEIMYSVRDNDETFVPAGNMLGKDFVSALITLWFFCSRSPAIVITTSSSQSQLKSVLWGEMGTFMATTKFPLPLVVNDMWLRQKLPTGEPMPGKCYVRGIVTDREETLQGHHLPWGPNKLPRTLAIFDEASSIEDRYYNAVDTWAHRKLIIGNPLPCSNIFYRAVKAGDVAR